MTLTIRADDAGDPAATALYTLVTPALSGAGNYTFTVPSGTTATLAANTDYYVHIEVDDDDDGPGPLATPRATARPA